MIIDGLVSRNSTGLKDNMELKYIDIEWSVKDLKYDSCMDPKNKLKTYMYTTL